MRKMVMIAVMFVIPLFVFAQEKDSKPKDRHEFKMVYQVKATPVVSQGRTGTCWSFASTSFVESELIRMGKGEVKLSEMFFARNAYITKADRFVRFQGKNNFGEGGQAHDVMNVIREKGFITEDAFSGLYNGEKVHNHAEMLAIINPMVQALSKNPGGKLSPRWKEAYEGVINAYLGKIPEKFTYDGKEYTTKSFAEAMGFNPDDYIEITSFAHHPFYTKCELEVPDNWAHEKYYNLPIDDVMAIMEHALKTGYSIDWDGDVSEKEFSGKDFYAYVPADDPETDPAKPEKEKTITDALRLEAFNNFSTTDDHLMHITGMAVDQAGTKFWYTKNSWGAGGKYAGFWYLSDSYARYKVVAILVHKDAIPQDIKAKMGL